MDIPGRPTRVLALATTALFLSLGLGLCAAERAASPPPTGIAARHPADAGIAKDPAVVFADDFEAWAGAGAAPPPKPWRLSRDKTGRPRAEGTPASDIPSPGATAVTMTR